LEAPRDNRGGVRPFRIEIAQPVLDDLRARLALTRWPDEVEGAGWAYGANREYLQRLIAYWQRGYDWRAQETKLNAFPQFKARVDDIDLHFIHIVGKGPAPKPLLLTHGWPDSFYRFVKLIPRLTAPAGFGGRAEDAFTVVVPDIPGFGFSDRPIKPGIDTVSTADMFARLMTEVLGYQRFLAHGGDFGASITEQLGLHHADLLPAIHLNNVPPQHAQKVRPQGLSPVEQTYLATVKAWGEQEGAFTALQNSKPQTLSYGLNDSPVGLLAWIIEKFHGWSDINGQLESVFTKDELLTNVMIYWVTQTAGSSARFYYEKAHRTDVTEQSYVTVPGASPVLQRILFPRRGNSLRGTLMSSDGWNCPMGGTSPPLKFPMIWPSSCGHSLRHIGKLPVRLNDHEGVRLGHQAPTDTSRAP
jgi:microsomal epoxide hydrolase